VEFDSDGEPTNVTQLVNDLATARPHLVNASGSSAGGAPGAAAPGSQPTKGETRSEFLDRMGY
jgi:hypothetical protein